MSDSLKKVHVDFYCRGTKGIWRVNGTQPPYAEDNSFINETSNECKCLELSANGERLAWHDGKRLQIYDTVKDKLLYVLDAPSVSSLLFSPKATVLATWQVYTAGKDKQPKPNLHIYDVKTGEKTASFHQKKAQHWQPQWSADEKVCARNVTNQVQFYEDCDFSGPKHKLHIDKVFQFSLAQNKPPYTVATYVPGSKGMPSNVRVFRYPNFEGVSAVRASKSFFKADRVTLYWNSLGTAMLVLTSTESSESSYYGEQGLHFLALDGESCVVPLAKNGPVYSVAWHPAGTEFTVLYGYMPAKCTIFNMKNDPIFDFGTGPRNQLYYNPFGNILCLAGFGNLQGNLEFWDLSAKKLISTVSAKDATMFEWAPDGCHVLTATLSPRIRVGNGYKIWHYTGSLMKDVMLTGPTADLHQVVWAPVPEGTFTAPTIAYKPVSTSERAPAATSAPAYRPPGARGKPATTKIHDYELPSNQKAAAIEASSQAPLSKNQKRKRAKAAAKESTAAAVSPATPSAPPASAKPSGESSAPRADAAKDSSSQPYFVALTGNPEKDKRIRNLSKKLQQIQKLKDDQKAGVVLQNNQLEKLKKEDELVDELENLSMS